MKGIKIYIIIGIPVLLVILFFVYLYTGNTKVFVPKELMKDKQIYLGQDIDDVVGYIEPKENNSFLDYYGDLADNQYFDEYSLSRKNFYLLYFTDIIDGIQLTGPPGNDPLVADSLAKEIIKILIKVWGNGYTIYDTGIYERIGKQSFILIWRTDSCSITFVYTPSELHEELSKAYPVVPFGYALGIHSDVNCLSDLKKSEFYTRESLGIE